MSMAAIPEATAMLGGGGGGGGNPMAMIASIAIPMLLELIMGKSKEEKSFESNLARLLATARGGQSYYQNLIQGIDPKISEALIGRGQMFQGWGFPQAGMGG